MNQELFKRILSSIILLPLALIIIIKGSYFFNFLLLITFLTCSYEWHLMSKNKVYYFFGFIFLLISFFCSYKLRNNAEDDYLIFLLVTVICVLTDIGGYIFGKIFKGPKLTMYSPNKTYAGVFGSYILSISSIPFILKLNIINEENTIIMFVFVFIISSISQLGDLCVSYFKRNSNIKDTGNIIPGHGGLLDRIDGMIFAYPFSYLITLISFFNIV